MATLAQRKTNALSLLDTHADSYRILYTELVNAKNLSDETEQATALQKVNRKMQILETESAIIHKQLQYLSELEAYEKAESAE